MNLNRLLLYQLTSALSINIWCKPVTWKDTSIRIQKSYVEKAAISCQTKAPFRKDSKTTINNLHNYNKIQKYLQTYSSEYSK